MAGAWVRVGLPRHVQRLVERDDQRQVRGRQPEVAGRRHVPLPVGVVLGDDGTQRPGGSRGHRFPDRRGHVARMADGDRSRTSEPDRCSGTEVREGRRARGCAPAARYSRSFRQSYRRGASSVASNVSSAKIDTIVALCKRRGFVFASGEIYGGTRSAWDYGPARRGAQGEHQAPVVEGDGHRPGRHRRPRQLGDPAAPGVGRVRARQRVPRPAGGVHALPQAVPGGPARRGVRRAHRQERQRRRPVGRPVPELRHPRPVHRAARLQHDAQDLPRPGGVRGRPALPAPGDGAGHLRELPERADDLAAQAPVRHRPDGQELPQRDHAGQLHLPHARVRADGDGVLRRAGHGRGTAPVLDRRAHALVRRPGDRAATTCGSTSTRRRSCRTTRSAPSTSSTASASPARNGASSRASRTAPIST